MCGTLHPPPLHSTVRPPAPGGRRHGLHGLRGGQSLARPHGHAHACGGPVLRPPSSLLRPPSWLWASWPCAQIFPSREHSLLLCLRPRNPEASAKPAEVTCHSRRERFLSPGLRRTWCIAASTGRSLVPQREGSLLTRETYSRGGGGGACCCTGTGGPLDTAAGGL